MTATSDGTYVPQVALEVLPPATQPDSPDSPVMNYESIKGLAKELKCKATDLIALAPQNDPFYVGAPAQRIAAEWFADIFNSFGVTGNVHVRRIHYLMISQEKPFLTPDGTPYENTEGCWKYLNNASKYARYLDLVDSALFVDKRNPDPVIYTRHSNYEPTLMVSNSFAFDSVGLDPFPYRPSYSLNGFETNQRYHLEIWCEKSTMNDVLEPLCRRYECNLVTGIGEMSATALRNLVANRLHPDHPARVFYISDFDPGGQSMPTAASRKCEFYIDKLGFAGDVKFYPIVMTSEQVKQYKLPRTPIKDTERRAARFEDRHGEGAVELDALEALYPGELNRIVRGELERYYDNDLSRRVYAERSVVLNQLEEIQDAVYDDYQDEITALEAEYEQIAGEFNQRIRQLNRKIQNVWQGIRESLQNNLPDIDGFEIPEPHVADEKPNALYDSTRDYLTQMACYKEFQGKEGAL